MEHPVSIIIKGVRDNWICDVHQRYRHRLHAMVRQRRCRPCYSRPSRGKRLVKGKHLNNSIKGLLSHWLLWLWGGGIRQGACHQVPQLFFNSNFFTQKIHFACNYVFLIKNIPIKCCRGHHYLSIFESHLCHNLLGIFLISVKK